MSRDPSGRDLPLMRWGEALREQRARRDTRRRRVAWTTPLPLALLVTIAAPPLPRLVWNATDSAPRGLWIVRPDVAIRRGDWVLARAPREASRLAASRGYLPLGVPLVKQVAAMAGDTVCARDRSVTVGTRGIADRLATDALGRVLPSWSGCRTLGRGDLLLVNRAAPRSFDGRYFGPSRAGDILGRMRLLWPR